MQPPIKSLGKVFHVERLLEQLDSHPEIWNEHTQRTQRTRGYATPHDAVSDIWVRYRDFADYQGNPSFFAEPHVSQWYPVVEHIPAVIKLVIDVMAYVGAKTLGGVLITRIPPGGQVAPHVDSGWHASHYAKYAVQLRSAPGQAFCFNGVELAAETGELYTFDNSQSHWVRNDSPNERMTLIICLTGGDL